MYSNTYFQINLYVFQILEYYLVHSDYLYILVSKNILYFLLFLFSWIFKKKIPKKINVQIRLLLLLSYAHLVFFPAHRKTTVSNRRFDWALLKSKILKACCSLFTTISLAFLGTLRLYSKKDTSASYHYYLCF